MTWKIKFNCRECNQEYELGLHFTSRELSLEAIAKSFAVHLKGVKLIQEENGKVKKIIIF